jgi:HlyD family secretion protein
VSVDNPDGALIPGMTATTRIIKAERSDVLTVPEQALRYRPGGRSEKRSAQAAAPGDKSVKAAGDKAQLGRVWLLRAGQPVPVQVTTGLDDGGSVEVLKGDLQAGDQVIVSEGVSDANAGARQQGAPRFLRFGGR